MAHKKLTISFNQLRDSHVIRSITLLNSFLFLLYTIAYFNPFSSPFIMKYCDSLRVREKEREQSFVVSLAGISLSIICQLPQCTTTTATLTFLLCRRLTKSVLWEYLTFYSRKCIFIVFYEIILNFIPFWAITLTFDVERETSSLLYLMSLLLFYTHILCYVSSFVPIRIHGLWCLLLGLLC